MIRPRRNRQTSSIRTLMRETLITPHDLIYPLFVHNHSEKEAIGSMPGLYRHSLSSLIEEVKKAYSLGIQGIALFPAIDDQLKDPLARESKNPDGLYPRAIREVKNAVPEMTIFSDVAMDPYSSDGHDGIVRNGEIINDETLEILAQMAVTQAEAGADYVSPSDMMDGRVRAIRNALDDSGFEKTGILAYSAKYASAFYGPFRDALDSAPKAGDKKTYQMDPANRIEAVREVLLDIEEGADLVMIKPALSYLDVIREIKEISPVPVAAYNVSGEYSLIKAGAKMGWLDENAAMKEMLTSIKRAGSDLILTYFAIDYAKGFQS